MKLRSFEILDFEVAWRRVMAGVRSEDLADRLPFELAERLKNSGHPEVLRQTADYSPRAPVVYFAPKESRTVRPLAVLAPPDLLVLQALVDQATTAMLRVLPPESVVFAYRLGNPTDAQSIQDRPWNEFQERAKVGLEAGASHILEADVAGFFLHIRPDVIVQRLLALGVDQRVCLDLQDLLAHFTVDGIQGLPQGIAPSSALSNLALAPLDEAMEGDWDSYFRYSDDLRFLARSFADAYLAQETVERVLYAEGFSLGAGKTFIRRAESALSRMTNLQASLDEIRDDNLRRAFLDAGPYDDPAPEVLADADRLAAEEFYGELVETIRQGGWSRDPLFLRKLRFILRVLGSFGSSVPLPDLENLVFRYPASIAPVARYLQAMAGKDPTVIAPAIEALLKLRRVYLPEFLQLGLAFSAAPLSVAGPAPALSEMFFQIALDPSANTILRRRAGLAAVALSGPGSTTAADIWTAFDAVPDPELSRLYVVAGAGSHPDKASLYGLWSGESRIISAATEYLARNRLDLGKV